MNDRKNGAMAFGTASVGQLPSTPRGGRPALLYDCGRRGHLSLAAIARIAGISKAGAAVRVRRGIRGDALCVRKEDAKQAGYRKRGCSSWVMVTACKLTQQYPEIIPTERQIQAIRPMSKQAASRWRSAIRDARAT